jgi:hypothetical protein
MASQVLLQGKGAILILRLSDLVINMTMLMAV